ncbi:selenocysteine-specific elongation factor [Salsuginibacillus halophilus]|uniref:Selenocysteine-specific elongation factor n=1 Tax=Salsuginibacillus halophilus TaxID=517424 RepID=A0A2P8HYL9_9BACI|nr:selenocysteine-specific translation elongation factor [Salsuginibacillus halophilus]PSL51316.1 selenocysteine-specific elongation factor [Salsuginibacillus halophilus]
MDANETTYTVGVAGHIDHGKTTLVKALTNAETDRLKEEQERAISIEPGFARLETEDQRQVSLIDVPGHEKFIRQMIAGVAGIDMVLMVIAADEGVMPQTKEHMDILTLLGIEHAVIALTKADQVEEELLDLVKDDVGETVTGTAFANAPIVVCDGVSGTGVQQVKQEILTNLQDVPNRDIEGAFRLPVDQVFTVHGQGTIVRGTVYEGSVREGEYVKLLPSGKKAKVRQLQVHHELVQNGQAGQRLAMNIGGIEKDEVTRGDVFVAQDHYTTTEVLDVSLTPLQPLIHPLKQRTAVKLHLGTAEVYGQIVFFDRNELHEKSGEVLCQIRLDAPVVTKRGDRFILRRPTPVETVGGGVVIEAEAGRYRFGEATIEMLEAKKAGTPADRIQETLQNAKQLHFNELIRQAGLSEIEGTKEIERLLDDGTLIKLKDKSYTLESVYNVWRLLTIEELKAYHEYFSMRQGKQKGELVESFSKTYPKRLIEAFIEKAEVEGHIVRAGPYLRLPDFLPQPPGERKKAYEHLFEKLLAAGLSVPVLSEAAVASGWEEREIEELRAFFIETNTGRALDERHIVLTSVFHQKACQLYEATEVEFGLSEAKDLLQTSRKYVVPFLEALDQAGWTKRTDVGRMWQHDPCTT